LLGAVPYEGVTRAALVVSIEPSCDLCQFLDAFDSPDTAAQVADVNRFPAILLRHLIPQGPDFQGPGHMRVIVLTVKRAARIGLLGRSAADLTRVERPATLTVADPQRTGARPAIREESVDRVAFIDFAVDRGHLLREIGAEHAGLVQPGRFVVLPGRAIRIALKPLGMPGERFLISVIAVHPRYDPHASPLHRVQHLAEKVSRPEKLAAMMIPHVCGIKRENTSAV